MPPSAVVVAGTAGTAADRGGAGAAGGGATTQTTLVLTLGRLGPGGVAARVGGAGFECLGVGGVWNSTPVESSTLTTVTLAGVPQGTRAVRYLWYGARSGAP